MVRIYNGIPMNKSGKSSAVKEATSEMATITSRLSSASSAYSTGIDWIQNKRSVRSSMSADPFTPYSDGDDIKSMGNINGGKDLLTSLLSGAKSMNYRYVQLNHLKRHLTQPNLGAELAKTDRPNSSEAETQHQFNMAYDPSYRASYETSASLASMSPASRSSMLQSLATRRHQASNINDPYGMNNGRIGGNWNKGSNSND